MIVKNEQELLDRIRDIRSSEKLFYQRVKDIYATSIDYETLAKTTQDFFASVQNKLHWAIHKHTAAELIYTRADAKKVNMGLTTWKSDKIRKNDVTIAKNYLSEMEIKELRQKNNQPSMQQSFQQPNSDQNDFIMTEIGNLKEIVLSLQQYTMDVNKMLLEDRIEPNYLLLHEPYMPKLIQQTTLQCLLKKPITQFLV